MKPIYYLFVTVNAMVEILSELFPLERPLKMKVKTISEGINYESMNMIYPQ